MAINNFNVGVGTTSQLTRYRYVATGGETSISGADADGKTLSYTVGLEQVFLNGVNLVRGQDYTATNGTSIGNLSALVASDSLEVFAYVPFNIANAVTASTVDAKGDLLVGTGADTVGRLAVGSTNGQLLAVDSSTSTGLKWANPGLTLLNTTSFSGVSSQSINDVFSSNYTNYVVLLANVNSNSTMLNLRFRTTTDDSGSNYAYQHINSNGTTVTASRNLTQAQINMLPANSNARTFMNLTIFDPNVVANTIVTYQGMYYMENNNGSFFVNTTTQYTGFTIYPTTGTITGTVSVYGVNK